MESDWIPKNLYPLVFHLHVTSYQIKTLDCLDLNFRDVYVFLVGSEYPKP